jgi:hypothetical protein
MSESMERSLGLWERLELRLHLIVCTWCARYLNQIKLLRDLLLEDLPVHTTSHTSLDATARARISESIRKQQHQHTSTE